MEQGRTEQILERLTDMIENGQSVPLSTGKVMVNKEEAVLMLKELSSIMESELRMYREVTDRRGKIITDARKEAEEIIMEAEQSASRIRVTKRISSVEAAYQTEKLAADEKEALKTAGDIYAASLIYTDEMLTEANDVIANAYDIMQSQYERIFETLKEKTKLIEENKAELMNSLHELSKEDRYAQILELGQLLSNELYAERMKARGYEVSTEPETDSEAFESSEHEDVIG
ncbi:MAG: hypothetical protein Q4D54_06585 [Eubacteriales bacterium]|nr:hypothetical protein [Lachnospiraceae bacterium]MDO5127396.1 hypothetical protein [Eubacteriales bacterium]